MNKDILAIVRGFRNKGYTVEQSTGTSHFFVRDPEGNLYTTLPSTPHARGVSEAQRMLDRAPDLKAAAKAQRKLAVAAALGAPAPVDAPAPAEQIAELPEVRDGKLPLTAWWLWDHLREEAERGGRTAQYQGQDGWMWTGHVTATILKLWPKLTEADDSIRREATLTLGEYLRLTTHAIVTKNRGPNAPSEYWLSGSWHGGPDTVGKARTIARGAKHVGSTHDRHIEQIQEAVAKLADTEGTVTTRQVVAELPDINANTISILLGEVVASKFPLSKIKNGVYKYEGKARMTQAPAKTRRSDLRLEVLRYKQGKPDTPESVAEVAAALDAAESSVGRALREWFLDGTQGIDRLTGNLYVFRPHLLPESHPLRNVTVEPEPEVAEPAEPVVPAAPTVEVKPVPAVKTPTRVAEQPDWVTRLLEANPNRMLYVEVTRVGDVIVITDEHGVTYQARKG